MKNIPCVLVGNKIDLCNYRLLEASDMELLAKQYQVQCMETSVKGRVNIELVYEKLVLQCMQSRAFNKMPINVFFEILSVSNFQSAKEK